jgi:TRAP-type mannitol/chloroaromatic compound transport system permease large subunit
VLVLYGLTISTSVGDLFIASTIRGIMLAVIYIAYVFCAINPKLRPPAPPELRNIHRAFLPDMALLPPRLLH